MADQSIFSQTNSVPSEPSPNQPPSDSGLQDLLASITNERGEQKYKTVAEALVGLSNAQNFISTLKSEKQQIEQQVNELRPVAEKVTELEKVVLQLSQTKPTDTTPSGVSELDVARLVEQTLTKQQQQQIAKDNLASVVSVVQKTFGDKAEEAFYGKAAQLGLSKEEINALAARTPKAALELIGVKVDVSKQSVFTPTTTSVNTSSITPPVDTFISRNKTRLEVGATAQELMQETMSSRKMVEEMNAKGMSIDDLTKPSNYFKFFK